MNPIICEAINEQRLLSLWWEGGERIVQPHAYGINARDNEMLRCWQIDGYSKSGRVPGWKPLLTEEAHSFTILEDTFEPHRQYRQNDKHMTEIFAQI